ncbi:MAG: polysaccharide deacetylase family protein [Dysosmobacter welbionis]
MIESAPDIVRRMAAEGHIVGNHTYHHPDMSSISDMAAFQKELTDLETLYQETTGQPLSKFYRPPQENTVWRI